MGTGCLGKDPIMYISHKPVLWTSFIVCQLLVAFGLLGNVLSYKILGYSKSRRNQSSTFYLRSLAIADCTALLLSTFTMSLQMMLRPALNLHPLNPISLLVNLFPLCNVRLYVSYASNLIATYLIVLFSVERCLVVLHPFRWMRFFTLRRARWAVATLTLFGLVSCLPALFSFYPTSFWVALITNATTGEETEMEERMAQRRCGLTCANCTAGLQCFEFPMCRMDLDIFKVFAMFHTLATSAVSLAITGVCNAVIITVLRRRDPEKLSQSSSSDDSQDRQITRRLILVSTVFLVLAFPQAVYHLVTNLMSGSYCNPVAADALTITLTLNCANFAINFVIYCISEQQFRKLFVALLRCKRHRLTRLLSYINEPARKRRQKSQTPTTSNAGQATSSSKLRRESQASDAGRQPEPQLHEALINEKAADYVKARQRRGSEKTQEDVEDCNDCSLFRDDWSSGMFAEDEADQPEVARWSQVSPE